MKHLTIVECGGGDGDDGPDHDDYGEESSP